MHKPANYLPSHSDFLKKRQVRPIALASVNFLGNKQTKNMKECHNTRLPSHCHPSNKPQPSTNLRLDNSNALFLRTRKSTSVVSPLSKDLGGWVLKKHWCSMG